MNKRGEGERNPPKIWTEESCLEKKSEKRNSPLVGVQGKGP